MAYSVKELVYTLQGEGVRAGRPAVFLRFAGCNLWDGTPGGRATGRGGCARWCDTDFLGTGGPGGGRFAGAGALAAAVAAAWPGRAGSGVGSFVVCTGGEPLLQLDAPLVDALHRVGFEVAVETNGTRTPPPGIDWLTVSPKAGLDLVVRTGHELKLVFPQRDLPPSAFEALAFEHFVLQPLDDPKGTDHTAAALKHCRAHPRWRLGLQLHKLLGIP